MKGERHACSRPRCARARAPTSTSSPPPRAPASTQRHRRRRAVVAPTTPPQLAKTQGARHRPRACTRASSATLDRATCSTARSRWGKGALKVRARGKARRRCSPASAPARVRHRRAGARSALVLLQHEAGPLRGLRGHRRAGRRRGAWPRARTEPCRTLRGHRGSRRCRARCGSRARATTRWCSSPSAPRSRSVRRAGRFEGDRALHRRAVAARSCCGGSSSSSAWASGYLSLDRAAATLSGGEMQRLRLAAQLGAGLTGALYVLDEPTIGLHPRDTHRLLAQPARARRHRLHGAGGRARRRHHPRGGSPHRPRAPGGRGGGHIVARGPARARCSRSSDSPTGRALARAARCGRARAPRRAGRSGSSSTGARANNLKGVDLRHPGGPAHASSPACRGSGKSTLVRQVLYPALREALGARDAEARAPSTSLAGAEAHQARARRRPVAHRPHAALGAGDLPRHLGRAAHALRGHARGASCAASAPARFSFNTRARAAAAPRARARAPSRTRCRSCPTSSRRARPAAGRASTPATLEVRYHGLSIGDVLRLSADEAKDVFARAAQGGRAARDACRDLGVGYLQLGQGSQHALRRRGAAAQARRASSPPARATSPRSTCSTSPPPACTSATWRASSPFLDRLVDRGDTLVVIEHHPAVIAAADHVVELGPEGGEGGGRIVAEGTPREVARLQDGHRPGAQGALRGRGHPAPAQLGVGGHVGGTGSGPGARQLNSASRLGQNAGLHRGNHSCPRPLPRRRAPIASRVASSSPASTCCASTAGRRGWTRCSSAFPRRTASRCAG